MKKKLQGAMKNHNLDIIIPISLDLDWPTKDVVVAEILEQHSQYGFTRFALACPCGGWRSIGMPPQEFFEERGRLFAEIRDVLTPYGIDCGWWLTTTVKTGVRPDHMPIVRSDGSQHPFAVCPLDPAFRRSMAECIATFAKVGKPSFIIFEDDYSIHAASGDFGCFCQHHLKEFAQREKNEYTREKLIEAFKSGTQDGYALLRRWRGLVRDSLVGMAEEIRKELDIDSPEIPMGYMQAGACDMDGDCTEAVCRAMAGDRHAPFVRLHGTFYGSYSAQNVPKQLFHAFYSKQHLPSDFIFYHESDTFPHTRFFTSGKEILALMGAAYAMGFDGSTFQTQQLLDCANEEPAYGKAFCNRRDYMNALHAAAIQCRPAGAELCYDPFWNNVEPRCPVPLWTQAVSLFGIPWVTTESDVAFWDKKQAMFSDEATVLRYLAKPLLFLDAEAARILNERGFGDLLGVSVGEVVTALLENKLLKWDLGAREVIRENFREKGHGCNMPSAHMFAPSNGVMLRMEPTDPHCEVITDLYTYDKRYITPAMTRFKNRLGGTVVVLAITLEHNYSQSLLNYRRQRLLQTLIAEHCDTLVFAKSAPRLFTMMSDASEESEFSHLLTVINLACDTQKDVQFHLPAKWQENEKVLILNKDARWIPASVTRTTDGITLHDPLEYLDVVCLMFK